MSHNDKLMQLIKQQVGAEREQVRRLAEIKKKVKKVAARLLLEEMRLDSEKHAAILTEMLEILKGGSYSGSLWEHELDEFVGNTIVKEEFEMHVKKEKDVLAHIEEELKHTKDDALKLLLHNITEDEKKHHKILQEIIRNLYKLEK